MTDRYAAVDIGSNSCLLLIVEKKSASEAHVVLDTKISTRVSANVTQQGAIGKENQESLFAALSELQNKLEEHAVDNVYAVGTQVFRAADNGDKVADQIREQFGWTLEVISGEEEARLSYMAAGGGLDRVVSKRVVADVGGGSTEIVVGEGATTSFLHSFPVGAVSLTELFGLDQPVTDFDLARADGYLSALLMGEEPGLPDLHGSRSYELIVTGGTIATMAGAFHRLTSFDPVKIHGTRLSADWVEATTEAMMTENAEARRRRIPFDPERAEIILAGTLLVRWLLNWSTKKSVIVSNRGLRWGIVQQKFDDLKDIEIKR